MADQTKAKAIITFTHSGYTAFRISSHRPNADIFVFTKNKKLLRILSLVWGVRAYYLHQYDQMSDAVLTSVTILKEKGVLKDDEVVIHVGSIPMNQQGKTNMVKLSYV
jgi:pyruvate kinase